MVSKKAYTIQFPIHFPLSCPIEFLLLGFWITTVNPKPPKAGQGSSEAALQCSFDGTNRPSRANSHEPYNPKGPSTQ